MGDQAMTDTATDSRTAERVKSAGRTNAAAEVERGQTDRVARRTAGMEDRRGGDRLTLKMRSVRYWVERGH